MSDRFLPGGEVHGLGPPEAHERGCALLDEERFLDALPFLKVASGDGDGPWFYEHNLGNAYLRLGRMDEAATAYRVALKKNARAADSRRSLVAALLCLGRHAEALPLAEASVLEFLEDPVCWIHLGNCLLHLGFLEEASRAYWSCIGVRGVSREWLAQAYAHLGVTERLRGNLDMAESYCGRALEFQASLGSAMWCLAQVFASTGRSQQASGVLERCIASADDETRKLAQRMLSELRSVSGRGLHHDGS